MFLHHFIVFTHVQERQIVQTAEQRVLGSTSASEHRQAGEKNTTGRTKDGTDCELLLIQQDFFGSV